MGQLRKRPRGLEVKCGLWEIAGTKRVLSTRDHDTDNPNLWGIMLLSLFFPS
jgi:hypothetical protein